jgi:small subunit ribosomal protein S6
MRRQEQGLNTYDVLFIFPSALAEDALAKLVETVHHEIDRQGGKIEREDRMGRRPFARPINKKEEGYYLRLWMRMNPELVTILLGRLRMVDEIIRVQVRRLDGEIPQPPAPADLAAKAPLMGAAAEVYADGQS